MRRAIGVLLATLVVSAACSDSPTGPDNRITELPALESIPLEALGSGTLVFERIARDEEYSGVYVVDVAAGVARGIGGRSFNGPQVSPDGERIVYTRLSSFNPDRPNVGFDIYMSDVDGRNEVRLTDLENNEVSPAWLPDGDEIMFYNGRSSGEIDIYRQPVSSGADQRNLVHTFAPETCPFLEGPVSLSPGGLLAFSAQFCGDLSTQGIYSVPMEGGEVAPISTSPGITSDGAIRFYSPSWSPDGRYLAFIEVLSDEDTQEFLRTRVWRTNADGSDAVTIASLESRGTGEWATLNVYSLCWSPDGSKIAFNHREGELNSHIFVVGYDGEDLHRVTSASGMSDHSISWIP